MQARTQLCAQNFFSFDFVSDAMFFPELSALFFFACFSFLIYWKVYCPPSRHRGRMMIKAKALSAFAWKCLLTVYEMELFSLDSSVVVVFAFFKWKFTGHAAVCARTQLTVLRWQRTFYDSKTNIPREIFHMSTVARLANMKNNRWWFLPAKNKKLHARHSLAEKKKSIANINHRNIIFSALCIAVERIHRREKFGFFPSQWRQMASKKCYTLEKRQQIESQQEAVISAKLKLGLSPQHFAMKLFWSHFVGDFWVSNVKYSK